MDNFSNQNHQPNQGKNQGLFSLPPAVMNFVPWIPLMLEMTTGQKIPQMTGTLADIQQGLNQLQMSLGQIIQHQRGLEQRLTALEGNAAQQFNSLAQQLQSIRSIRLTHDRERKQIDYNLQREQE